MSRLRYFQGLALLVFALDQLSKAWAIHSLSMAGALTVSSWFNFSLAFNKGAAFSLLSDGSPWQWCFLVGFALIMLVWIVYWLKETLAKPEPAFSVLSGLALLFGGGLGNLIDRARLGQVVDFIQWHYQDWYWPTFNVADMAIFFGVCLLAKHGLKTPQPA